MRSSLYWATLGFICLAPHFPRYLGIGAGVMYLTVALLVDLGVVV